MKYVLVYTLEEWGECSLSLYLLPLRGLAWPSLPLIIHLRVCCMLYLCVYMPLCLLQME